MLSDSRRSRKFWGLWRARAGVAGFGMLLVLALGAPLVSGNRPLLMKREGVWTFPAFRHYPASSFGETDALVVDFKQLVARDRDAARSVFAVFPVNEWDPFEQTAEVLAAPSASHWLGTDSLGRDVVARLIFGLRVSIGYGLLFWCACFLIGVTLGTLQGYFAGFLDFSVERLKELLEILPFLSVVILVNGLMKADSFWVTLMVVVLFSWLGISSQIRVRVLSIRNQEFCEAARASGAGSLRILFLHVLPNSITPILTLTPFTISAGITTLTVLDYLGFGLSPPTPSLGELLQQGRASIQSAPWLLIAPTLVLSTTLISINLIGESLREALNRS